MISKRRVMGWKPVRVGGRGKRKRTEIKKECRRERDEVKRQDRNEMLGAFMCFYGRKKTRYKLGHTQLSLWDLCSRDFRLLERLLTVQWTTYFGLIYCHGAHSYNNFNSKFSLLPPFQLFISHALCVALIKLTQITAFWSYHLLYHCFMAKYATKIL